MGVIVPSALAGSEVGCDPEQAADVFASLASPWRVEIVRVLAADDLSPNTKSGSYPNNPGSTTVPAIVKVPLSPVATRTPSMSRTSTS